MSELGSNRSSFANRSVSNVSGAETPSHPVQVDYDFGPSRAQPAWLPGLDFDDPMLAKKHGTTMTVVACRVCEAKIPLAGYDLDEHYIVKCNRCKEATPIRPAPPGEKYIRCVCNCLLICRDSANKIACPRLNCQRIIAVSKQDGDQNQPGTTAIEPPQGTSRLTCGYCRQPFIFNIAGKSLTKCPYCANISAIDDEHYRTQKRHSSALAIVFVLMALLIIIGNVVMDQAFTGEYALYFFVVCVAIIICIRPIISHRLKTSHVDGSI